MSGRNTPTPIGTRDKEILDRLAKVARHVGHDNSYATQFINDIKDRLYKYGPKTLISAGQLNYLSSLERKYL